MADRRREEPGGLRRWWDGRASGWPLWRRPRRPPQPRARPPVAPAGSAAGCAPAAPPIRGSPAPVRRGWSCFGKRLLVTDQDEWSVAEVVAHPMRREAHQGGLELSVRELLAALAGVQETVLLYPAGKKGRPRAQRVITDTTQQRLRDVFNLSAFAPRR